MTIPQIPEKYRHIPLRSIKKDDVSELFSFLVRKICLYQREGEYLTHIQMSNLIFNEKDSIYLKKITNEYNTYFDYKGQKRRLLIEKIYQEHPHIWTGQKQDSAKFSKDEIINAIESEIRDTKNKQSQYLIHISEITPVTTHGGFNIYKCKINIENDDYISFSEGIQVKLVHYGNKYYVTVLDFNNLDETLSFQTTATLNFEEAKIQMSNLGLLYKLKELLSDFTLGENPLGKLLNGKRFPNKIASPKDFWKYQLDDSQKISLANSLNNDITFIWGPPGTGKSFTLSRLLLNLYTSGERTVVCAVANVAVDGLILKTIDAIDKYFSSTKHDLLKERKIIRLGYSQADKVRELKEIQFENEGLNNISSELHIVNEKINLISEQEENEDNEKRKLQLISKRDQLRRKYDTISKNYLSESKLLFLTSSKFLVEGALNDMEIDNLVIDEGSMMSIPHLMILAKKVKKRIIISGDFRQLGPISLSNSFNAKKWLHRDLFSLLGNESQIIKHPSLSMLVEQRRSAEEIAELINKPFYNGRLITRNRIVHFSSVDAPPRKGNISFLYLKDHPLNKAEFSRNKSKYNSYSRMKTMELIYEIAKSQLKISSVGIITPYRQQVIDYKKDIEKIGELSFELRVGTIHTFQGSECDIIIWDIVDSIKNPVGALYKGDTGKRLVNVAISRAISKLIIVGNNRFFNECDGRDMVSIEVKKIVAKAWKLSHKKEYGMTKN